MTAPIRVGFAGLGVMGSAMSDHLLRADVAVLGYDPDPDRMTEHRGRGGQSAAGPADLAGTEVVVTSLPSVEALDAVVDEQTGLPAGLADRDPTRLALVVLETSTLPMAAKTRAAERLAGVGATLLDCPMSGTGQQARDGDLVAYLSGDDATAKARVASVLTTITRTHYDVGAFGNGMKVKLVANLLVAINNVAAAEALLLAQRAGLDLDQVLAAVGDGAGGSRMFQIRGPLMARGDFDDATMRISTFAKDIAIIDEFVADVGTPTPLFQASRPVYDRAADEGRGDQDTASVFAVLDEWRLSDEAG